MDRQKRKAAAHTAEFKVRIKEEGMAEGTGAAVGQDPICADCGRPASALKSKFNRKQGKHMSCILGAQLKAKTRAKKEAKAQGAVSSRPEESPSPRVGEEVQGKPSAVIEGFTGRIVVDFEGQYKAVFDELCKEAKRELRDPDKRIIHILATRQRYLKSAEALA